MPAIQATFHSLPDPIFGLIGQFAKNPVPFLCTSKQISKQATVAYQYRNKLAEKVLLQCEADVDRIKPDFLRSKKWQKTITSLNLLKYEQMNDEKLRKIALAFPHLRELHIKGLQTITDEGIEHLTQLPLKTLALESYRITKKSFLSIAEITTLQKLHLRIENYAPLSLRDFERLDLVALSLRIQRLVNDDLEHLPKMRGLEELALIQCPQITDDGIQHLEKCDKLQKLWIKGAPITGRSIQTIANIQTIRKLLIRECQFIDNEALGQLANSKGLEKVYLSKDQIKMLSWHNVIWIQPLRKLYVDTIIDDCMATIRHLIQTIQSPKLLWEAIYILCSRIIQNIISLLSALFAHIETIAALLRLLELCMLLM
jgi:hypothetical protein